MSKTVSSTYRTEPHNLDGCGTKRVHVYDMPAGDPYDYWATVTDVPCPCCDTGKIRWAEAGYVAGYRICDGCGRHFLANGDAAKPTLLRVGSRRSRVA